MELSPDKKIEDLMINGLKIIQSENYYRFTSDSVMLAKFPEKSYDNVLDLCAGSGIVGLHFFGEYGAKRVTFVEIQKDLAEMCRETIVLNGLNSVMNVENLNLKDFDGKKSFDAVLCNPPYEKFGSGILPDNERIAVCKAEVFCSLNDIVNCARNALKDGGRLFMCHKTERLTDVITSFRQHKIEPVRLRFIKGKGKKGSYLFLIEGVKNKKLPLKIEGEFFNDATDFKG